MTHTKWQSDGQPTGLVKKVLLASLPTGHGLMGTSIRGFVRVWQRNSAQFTFYTCEGMPEHPVNVDGLKAETFSGVVHAHPVAISLLVKNPDATHEGCKIYYHDIGDYLTRGQKLEALNEAVSIKGFSDWETITPNRHYDWVDQRSDAFAEFYPIGTKEAKAGKPNNAIFKLFSSGYKTSRDAYIYKFLT